MGRGAARAAWESRAGSRPSIPVTLRELQGRRAGPGVAGPSLLQPCARSWEMAPGHTPLERAEAAGGYGTAGLEARC